MGIESGGGFAFLGSALFNPALACNSPLQHYYLLNSAFLV